MFDRFSKWVCTLLDQRDEIDCLQSNLDMYKSECLSYELLSIGMEYELDNEYNIALKYYRMADDKYSNSKAKIHIAICLRHLGMIDEAKAMIVEIRPWCSFSESRKIGRLLEEGFFGAPDYYEARKWYMTNAWCEPNHENIIIARENLKRVLNDFRFEDYCHKCGKKLLHETIYFTDSFDPKHEFCSECVEIAPFIFTLNPQTGEMSRSTYECDWKSLTNAQGEFPLLKSMFKDDTNH